MTRSGAIRAVSAAVVAVAASAAMQPMAAAAGPPPPTFPGGVACPFALNITQTGTPSAWKYFRDKNGTIVRGLLAGNGVDLLFENYDTHATLALKANGAVNHATYNPDGSQTWMTTGHNVLILFPTDVPVGPSTTYYVGRVVFTVDPQGNFTMQSTAGNSTDICAALSG